MDYTLALVGVLLDMAQALLLMAILWTLMRREEG
jgi:hypothetical protein